MRVLEADVEKPSDVPSVNESIESLYNKDFTAEQWLKPYT